MQTKILNISLCLLIDMDFFITSNKKKCTLLNIIINLKIFLFTKKFLHMNLFFLLIIIEILTKNFCFSVDEKERNDRPAVKYLFDLNEMYTEEDAEEFEKLSIENLPQNKVSELNMQNVNAASTSAAAAGGSFNDFSKLNFPTKRPNSATHVQIAKSIHESKLQKISEEEKRKCISEERRQAEQISKNVDKNIPNTDQIIISADHINISTNQMMISADHNSIAVQESTGTIDQSMPTSAEQKDQNPGKSDQSIFDPNQQSDQIIEKVTQNIGVTDQTNVQMDVINESANSEIRKKLIQMPQGSADQAQPMSEGTIIIDLIGDGSDQSSKKKSNSDPNMKKSEQKIRDSLKVQQKMGKSKKQSPRTMERTGSTTTIANEFASIPQHDQTGTNDNANPNDQTNFVKPNDQQLVKPRETGQLMPMTADNLNLASLHEADNVEQFVMIPTPNMRQINAENRVNSKRNSKSGEKTDFGAAESINEASPSTVQRKRGRSKTLKIQDKNAVGKSKMGVEKPSMKSAKDKSKMTEESLPIDQADVAIPNTILGMFLYGKGKNKRRAFFVKWDDCGTVSPCWVQSDEINALKLVTDFIEKCSIDSVLSAFSGGPVMSHVAKLLEKKAEAIPLMKSIGIQAGKLAKEKIVFSKFTTQMEKDMAIKQKEKFMKSIK